MSFLRDLALAHQRHEGYGTKNAVTITQNNNPGALRWHPAQKAFGGVKAPGFTKFPSYELGFQALMADLQAKITGHSSHIDYRKNPKFLDYIKVYAPAEDRNNPNSYAQALVRDLSAYGITLSTPLSDLAKLISQPAKEPVFNPREAVRRLQRLIDRALEPRRTRLQKRR